MADVFRVAKITKSATQTFLIIFIQNI